MKDWFLKCFLILFVVSLSVGCTSTAAPTPAPVASSETVSATLASAPEQSELSIEMPDYPEPPAGTEMVNTEIFKKPPPWTIAYADASVSNPWRVFNVASLYYQASKYPELIKEIIHTNANDSVTKQIADMEDLITQGVDAIIVASAGVGLEPVIEKAMDAGIPVILMEREVNTSKYVTWVDVNVPETATKQAEALVEKLGGEGNIIVYGVIPGLVLSEQQENSYKAVWEKNPGIKVLAFDYDMVSRSTAKTLMESWLQQFDQIDGVISWTGTPIQGAVDAAKEAGRYDEVKVWVGSQEQGFLQLISGGMPGVGYDNHADLTIDCLDATIRTLSGQPVPKLWQLPVKIINSDNIDQYVNPSAPETWFPSRIPKDDVQHWLDVAAKN